MNDVQITKARARRADWIAAVIAACIGAPLVFVYARAMADGESQRREAPLRAVIGEQFYEPLTRGEKTEYHYLGNELLAPDFTLPDRAGKPWRLRDQRGKIVVMNFWSIDCPPCLEELPSYLKLAEIAARRGDIEVVAVTVDKDWSKIAALFPPSFALRVLFDPKRAVVRDRFGSRLFPETWVIDKRGVVRMRIDGPRDWSQGIVMDAIQIASR